MNKRSIRKAVWYPYAAAACIAVALYVLLTRLPGVWAAIDTFIGYFKPLIVGCVIAYIVNPLARLFERTVFRRVKRDGLRRALSNTLTVILVILFFVAAMLLLIPELAASVQTFSSNFSGYAASLSRMLEKWGLSSTQLKLDELINSSESLLNTVTEYVTDNIGSILSTSATAGKALFRLVVAFILAIYLLAEKQKLRVGVRRLLLAMLGEKRWVQASDFLHRCDVICTRYIVYNLIDCFIIGAVNALFMTIAGMQYVGLVSFVVAAANLVPTVGPVVGGAVGAFVLLLVHPMHALIFLIFTVVLQLCDGYILKPRLFGSSLGVSGLWILVGIIVGGAMFGIVGMLVAIPAVAIIDLIYNSYLLPWLEARRQKADRLPEPPQES